MGKFFLSFVFLSIFSARVSVFADSEFVSATPNPKVINWYLVHEPAEVFRHATVKFKEILEKKTHGSLKVNVVSNKQLMGEYGNVTKVLRAVQEGKIQMTQTYTNRLAVLNKEYLVFDLPFLFKGYRHADKVLEGKTGQRLLASLDNYNLKGLAFTYSGGTRVILTKEKEIRSPEDFAGLKIRVANSPVFASIYENLGAQGKPMSVEAGYEGVLSGEVDGFEATYVRYAPKFRKKVKVLNDTGHTLFLTTLVMNKDFFNSLTKTEQAAVKEAALEAGRVERDTTIADSKNLEISLPRQGVKIVKMDQNSQKRFSDKLRPVYKKFENQIGKGLVSEILAQKE